MEEINLFNELNFIKNEIEQDLLLLEKVQNDLKLKVIYENNKELSNTVSTLSQEFNFKMKELTNKNNFLEKQIIDSNNKNVEKDNEIEYLKKNINDFIMEKKTIEENLIRSASNYLSNFLFLEEIKKFENIVDKAKNERDLEKQNKELIRSLFE